MASRDPGVARKDLLGRDGGEAVPGSESGGARQRREGAPRGGGRAVEASERARRRAGSARCSADLRARAHGHGAGSAPSASASPRSPALRREGSAVPAGALRAPRPCTALRAARGPAPRAVVFALFSWTCCSTRAALEFLRCFCFSFFPVVECLN